MNLETSVMKQLGEPLPGGSAKVNSQKLRRLYLQASSEQWFGPNELDFAKPVTIDPAAAATWRKLGTIFYTLEKMGLGVLDNMVGKAVRKLESDDAAFYLSTQCADEARHVFLIENYLKKIGWQPKYDKRYLTLGRLASLGAYRVENWLFSTLFSESFASAFLRHGERAELDDFGRDLFHRIRMDESRHLHFLYIVLPSVVEDLSLLGRAYVKTSQYFIMKFTERVSAELVQDGLSVGISRRDILEETFENVKKAYDGFGVGRDFLRFPKVGLAH